MKAVIKGYHSPDIKSLETYTPKEAENFCFYLELSIGSKDEEGEEIFGITVCTPKWLLTNKSANDILFLRHHLIVFNYDFQNIKTQLERKVQKVNGNNWDEISLHLSRFAHWEFEDYQEYKEV